MKTIAQQLNVKKFPFRIKDSEGNRIYVEYCDGAWIKQEYDSMGKEIYHEESNGYWVKSEYDANGNQIYLEYSSGTTIDNRPKTEIQKAIELLEKKD